MKHWLIQQFNNIKRLLFAHPIDETTVPTLMQNIKWEDIETIQGYQLMLAQWDDIAQMEEIQSKGYDGYIAWRQQDFMKDWQRNPYALYIVLKNKDKIIAMISGRILYKGGHISHVIVLPEYQGQGLGKLLVMQFQKIAMDLQSQRITLEVRKNNEIAQNLYRNLGFKVISEQPNYYYNNGETAVIMNWETRGTLNELSSSPH